MKYKLKRKHFTKCSNCNHFYTTTIDFGDDDVICDNCKTGLDLWDYEEPLSCSV